MKRCAAGRLPPLRRERGEPRARLPPPRRMARSEPDARPPASWGRRVGRPPAAPPPPARPTSDIGAAAAIPERRRFIRAGDPAEEPAGRPVGRRERPIDLAVLGSAERPRRAQRAGRGARAVRPRGRARHRVPPPPHAGRPEKPAFGLTLGFAELLAARKVLAIVSGAGKREQLRRLLSPRSPPGSPPPPLAPPGGHGDRRPGGGGRPGEKEPGMTGRAVMSTRRTKIAGGRGRLGAVRARSSPIEPRRGFDDGPEDRGGVEKRSAGGLGRRRTARDRHREPPPIPGRDHPQPLRPARLGGPLPDGSRATASDCLSAWRTTPTPRRARRPRRKRR
jgi:hypothetical protein